MIKEMENMEFDLLLSHHHTLTQTLPSETHNRTDIKDTESKAFSRILAYHRKILQIESKMHTYMTYSTQLILNQTDPDSWYLIDALSHQRINIHLNQFIERSQIELEFKITHLPHTEGKQRMNIILEQEYESLLHQTYQR